MKGERKYSKEQRIIHYQLQDSFRLSPPTTSPPQKKKSQFDKHRIQFIHQDLRSLSNSSPFFAVSQLRALEVSVGITKEDLAGYCLREMGINFSP